MRDLEKKAIRNLRALARAARKANLNGVANAAMNVARVIAAGSGICAVRR